MRILFFLERELHLPVLAPVMEEVHARGLGPVAIASVAYHPSGEGVPGRGLRSDVLRQALSVPFQLVENPHEYKPDITFLADFSYQFVEGLGTLVNLGHGTICKGWYFSKGHISRRENCADLICVPGEVHRRVLSEQVRIPIEVTGMPKLDVIFRNIHPREYTLRSMGLDPLRRTVLFAPTFNAELSIAPYVGARLRELVPPETNLIIKLHGAAPEDWKAVFRRVALSPNTYYSESPDIAPAFAAADVLLTDVSSVIYEFLALDKPVVLFDSPTRREYANYREDDLENVFRDVGIRIGDAREIIDAIRRSLSAPPSPQIRQIARDFISIRDGFSARRVVDAAIRVHGETRPRGTIILRSDSPNRERWQNIFANHYTVLTAGTPASRPDIPASPNETPFAVLDKAMSRVVTDTVMYYDARQQPSPLLASMMFAHFHYRPDAGAVFPLMEDDGSPDPHQLRFHVRPNPNLPKEAIGWQLTYSLTGESRETEGFTLPVFALRKSVWNADRPFTDLSHVHLSRLEFLRKVYLSGLKPVLALDSYICPNPEEPPMATEAEPLREDTLRLEVERDPGNPEKVKALIRFYFEEGRYEMVDVYEAMIPPDPEILLLSGIALDKQGFPEKALERISQIDTLSFTERPLLTRVLSEKGRLLLKASRRDEAVRVLEEAIRISSDAVEALVHLGVAHMLTNDAEQAARYFGRALQIDPNHISALYGLGLIRQAADDIADASAQFDRVLKLQPDHLNALNGLLACAYRTRLFDPLLDALDAYLRIKPDDLQLLYVQAGVLFETRRIPEATRALDLLLRRQPDFPGGTELQNRILAYRS
jgi:tetratricopeptide (TPR) repeat protein